MLDGGVVRERGTYADLVASGEDFADLMKQHASIQQQHDAPADGAASASNDVAPPAVVGSGTGTGTGTELSAVRKRRRKQDQEQEKRGKTTTAEERDSGAVKTSNWRALLRAATPAVGFLLLVLFVFTKGSQLGMNFWMADWCVTCSPAFLISLTD